MPTIFEISARSFKLMYLGTLHLNLSTPIPDTSFF